MHFRAATIFIGLAFLGVALAACGQDSSTASDMRVVGAADQAPAHYFGLTGHYSTQIRFTLGDGADGGPSGTLDVNLLFNGYSSPNKDGTFTVHATWAPCSVELPGKLSMPYPHALEQALAASSANGSLSGFGEASYTQPAVTLLLGACLAKPVSDPLPLAGAKLCPHETMSLPWCYGDVLGCAFNSTDSGGSDWPGLPVSAKGFEPDADVLYVDARVTFALQGTVRVDGTVSGTATAGAMEWHVLGCHLRAGGVCSAGDVAQIEAARPQATLTGGLLRAHVEPAYYTCAQFLADVEGTLAGREPPDGGVPDAGAGAVDPGTGSFQEVQRDLDALGCATCHDRLYSSANPKAMRLTFDPRTAEELRANYMSVLPWTNPNTMAPDPMPGGRFVNQVPLPETVRARWLRWISDGARFE